MGVYEEFVKLNQDYTIQPIDSKEFHRYGVVLKDYDLSEIEDYMSNIAISNPKLEYVASNPELENIRAIKQIGNDVYGGMDFEAGECSGQTSMFDGMEYHQGSEVNIMMTDVVMVLSKRSILDQKGLIDSNADTNIFFVPAGTAIDFYGETLHYAPIKVHEEGFKSVVLLLKGTNEPFPIGYKTKNSRLTMKNKFQLIHEENQEGIANGLEIGIVGELLKFKQLD
ncbi:DUF4867 family protein [Lactobacillus terrae]|uniref:DUF4867 family protein n=1 Tax=Lactobacillus terrae TaxID=2269374 RepID=UPI000C1B6539|nr:DUF4867 family protein [Lactobacillus terrae]